MRTYNAQLHDFSGRSAKKWKQTFDRVNQFLEEHLDAKIVFTLIDREDADVVWNPVPRSQRNDRTGKMQMIFHPEKEWFRNLVSYRSVPADFAIGFFSIEQWKRTEPFANNLGGQSIDHISGVTSEIILTGDEKRSMKLVPEDEHDEISGRLLHELGHSFADHKLGMPDMDHTHQCHYTFGDLAIHYRLMRVDLL